MREGEPAGAGFRQEFPQKTSIAGIVFDQQDMCGTGAHLVPFCGGTGKTTITRAIIQRLRSRGHTVLLAAPTGRAAKRLSEATGQPARTIHRMLGFSPAEGGFLHNDDNPLDADMIVVDEASMIDLVLCYSLLRAIPPDAHLLLVGDADQLPSVGAGNVLHDVIRGSVGKVTRLDVIFRQAETSHIITNAHRINRGESPDTSKRSWLLYTSPSPRDRTRYRLPSSA